MGARDFHYLGPSGRDIGDIDTMRLWDLVDAGRITRADVLAELRRRVAINSRRSQRVWLPTLRK